MDVHAPLAVTEALRQRAVDVLTAQEDGKARLEDPPLLDRATTLGRVLFTQDEDFLAEAARRQRAGQPFDGIAYAHQMRVTIGQCVRDLELMAKLYESADMANRLEHCGERSIRLRPVLDIKSDVIDEALGIMQQECARLSQVK
jgi:predicted nuclease of predicted toxin-antitoxin system